MRITRKDVEQYFKIFMKQVIVEDKESYSLEYVNIYGGYVIVKRGENGSESHPFSHTRRKPKEMFDCLSFAISVMQYQNAEFRGNL